MSRRPGLGASRTPSLDKGDLEPMRTRSRRAVPGVGLALALGLTAPVLSMGADHHDPAGARDSRAPR